MKRCLILCLALWMMLCSCAIGQGKSGTDLKTPSASTVQTTTLTENVDASETPKKPADTVETSATTTVITDETEIKESREDSVASYGEWFLSPITFWVNIKRIEVSPTHENWVVKTPVNVTEVRDGLEYTFEFFKEIYRFGEGLQVRLTVKNVSEQGAEYTFGSLDCKIHDGEKGRTWVRFDANQDTPKIMPIPGGYLDPQETETFEFLFFVDEKFFDKEGDHYELQIGELAIPLEVIADYRAPTEVEDIIASYGEWFLSPITYTAKLRIAQVAEEYTDWIVRTPKQVNVTRGELDITVDFFRSNHRLDESMQVRVTVRNTSDESFLYRGPTCYTINWQEDGRGLMGDWTKFREEQTYKSSLKEIAPHGEAVFEYLFLTRAGAYVPTGDLNLHFDPVYAGKEPYDYQVEIPLEVIAN